MCGVVQCVQTLTPTTLPYPLRPIPTPGGQWERAAECFGQMLAQGCTPDSITFGALITAYERGGQWRRALQAFAQMPSHGCHPDGALYSVLLEVCWRSGVLPAQMRATQIWTLANRSGHFRWVKGLRPRRCAAPSHHLHDLAAEPKGSPICFSPYPYPYATPHFYTQVLPNH